MNNAFRVVCIVVVTVSLLACGGREVEVRNFNPEAEKISGYLFTAKVDDVKQEMDFVIANMGSLKFGEGSGERAYALEKPTLQDRPKLQKMLVEVYDEVEAALENTSTEIERQKSELEAEILNLESEKASFEEAAKTVDDMVKNELLEYNRAQELVDVTKAKLEDYKKIFISEIDKMIVEKGIPIRKLSDRMSPMSVFDVDFIVGTGTSKYMCRDLKADKLVVMSTGDTLDYDCAGLYLPGVLMDYPNLKEALRPYVNDYAPLEMAYGNSYPTGYRKELADAKKALRDAELVARNRANIDRQYVYRQLKGVSEKLATRIEAREKQQANGATFKAVYISLHGKLELMRSAMIGAVLNVAYSDFPIEEYMASEFTLEGQARKTSVSADKADYAFIVEQDTNASEKAAIYYFDVSDQVDRPLVLDANDAVSIDRDMPNDDKQRTFDYFGYIIAKEQIKAVSP